MEQLIPFAGQVPQRPRFLAGNACLIGAVRCGADVSVWFQCVVRGDLQPVVLGDRVNVQDGSVIHVSHGQGCEIGEDSSLGHAVVAHACRVGRHCLLGLGCRVLDGVVLGDWCLVAAGAVVPEGLVAPEGSLLAGVPARIVGPVQPRHRARIEHVTASYLALMSAYGA